MTAVASQSAPAVLTDRNSEAGRLARAVEASDKRLDAFRKQRLEFLRHFAGPYYGQSSLLGRQPLNLIYSVASILEPALAMPTVRASVTTRRPELRHFAERQRLTLDWAMGKMRAAQAVRATVRDSLFLMGIVKVAWDGAGTLPFVESVSPDDYIIDRRAQVRKPGAYAFEGHRFRLPLSEFMDGDLLTREGKDIVERQAKYQQAQDKAAALSDTGGAMEEDFEPLIELIELFIPPRKGIVWLPGGLDVSGGYVHEAEWYGHEDGPLDVLGYAFVPDNAVPVPIMAIIFDLYLLENVLAGKIGDQALSQKDVAVVNAPSAKPGEDIRKAQDGDFVHAPGAKVDMASFGGANEKGYAAVAWFHDFLTRLSGNTDLVGGLKAQSATLGQDQILLSNASARTNDMRSAVYAVASSVVNKAAWYLWNDPELVLSVAHRLPGGIELPVRWTPNERLGEFEDFDFDVAAYSRATGDPEQRYQRVKDLLTSIILPIAPLAAQQGSRLDVDTLVNIAGRDLDIPEIEDLWIEGMPVEGPAAVAAGRSAPAAPGSPTPTRGRPTSPVEDMGAAAVEAGAMA